jgi:hypothetical protein
MSSDLWMVAVFDTALDARAAARVLEWQAPELEPVGFFST